MTISSGLQAIHASERFNLQSIKSWRYWLDLTDTRDSETKDSTAPAGKTTPEEVKERPENTCTDHCPSARWLAACSSCSSRWTLLSRCKAAQKERYDYTLSICIDSLLFISFFFIDPVVIPLMNAVRSAVDKHKNIWVHFSTWNLLSVLSPRDHEHEIPFCEAPRPYPAAPP